MAVRIEDQAWYERLYEALIRGLLRLPQESREQLLALFDASTAWALLLLLGGWAAAQLVGVGEVADLALVLYGVYSIGDSIFKAGSHLWDFATGAIAAKTDKDLDTAAGHFADAIGEIGITALEAFLGGKVFEAARAAIGRIRPAPKGLKLERLPEEVRERARKVQGERPTTVGAEGRADWPDVAGGVGLSRGSKKVGGFLDDGGWLWLLLGAGLVAAARSGLLKRSTRR